MFGQRTICWVSVMCSLMHIFPVCCIDLFITSLSIGPLQYSISTVCVPVQKLIVKQRPHFTFLFGEKYLILAVIPEGILYWLHLLPAGSAYFPSHNLAYCIIGTALLSVCPSFLFMTVLWVDWAVISSNGYRVWHILEYSWVVQYIVDMSL